MTGPRPGPLARWPRCPGTGPNGAAAGGADDCIARLAGALCRCSGVAALSRLLQCRSDLLKPLFSGQHQMAFLIQDWRVDHGFDKLSEFD